MGVVKKNDGIEYNKEKEPLKTLFVVEDYMTEEEIAKQERKRGHYRKKEPKINTIINPYTEMKNLYQQLANFMPIPLFSNKTEAFSCSNVRIWHYVYNRNKYIYQSKIYEGEDFKVVEAEIIGTETLYIDDRIRLHKKLINMLSNGIKLDKALDIIQPEIRRLKGEL